MKEIKPCERCNSNRWKTKEKGRKYECRKCGATREIKNN